MNARIPLLLLLPARTVTHTKVSRADEVNLGECVRLEKLRDYHGKRETLSKPVDFVAKPSEVAVTLGDQGAFVRFMTPKGPADPILLTKVAFQQMSRIVLPSHGAGFMIKTADVDTRALPMLTALWAMHAKTCDTPMTYRTQLIKQEDGRIVRAVMAMVTQTYAPYSHGQLLQAALDALGNKPVIEHWLTDTTMKLRIIDPQGENFELGRQVKMVQMYNSETGHRSAVVKGGLFSFVCTNGMGTWSDAQQRRWRHVGDTLRISREVPDAINAVSGAMDEVLVTYNKAIDIFIDDAVKYAEAELRRHNVSQTIVSQVTQIGMKDPTSSQFGSLAGVVDGMTLIAQNQDIDTCDLLENIAADVLRRGLRAASDSRIKVLA